MSIKKTPTIIKNLQQLNAIKDFFLKLQETRQNAFDNKSDTWHESEKSDEEQENIDMLETINDSLGEVIDELNDLFTD